VKEDEVTINNEKQAIEVLDNSENDLTKREEAARFLEDNPSENAIQRLIKALTDDDFGVRWAASTALSKLGDPAIPALLKTLMEDTSPRMRESAYHVLHYNDSQWVRMHSKPLMDAIKNIACDVTTPKAAYQMLKEFNSRDKMGTHDRSTQTVHAQE
jgi:HEAT repeat protein